MALTPLVASSLSLLLTSAALMGRRGLAISATAPSLIEP